MAAHLVGIMVLGNDSLVIVGLESVCVGGGGGGGGRGSGRGRVTQAYLSL